MKQQNAKILLLRHGQKETDPVFRYTGQREVPLSRHGRAQARHWGKALRASGIVSIYASPLSRCLDTAQIIGRLLEQPVRPVPELKEIALGEWEGLTKEMVKELYPGSYEERGRDMGRFRPPGGESFADLLARARPFAQSCLETRQPILAVTHAGVIRVLSCWAAGIPLECLFDFHPPPASMTVIRSDHSSLQLSAIGLSLVDFSAAVLAISI